MVTDYWDVICEDGFRRPIWGFSFHIDTGKHTTIFCKPPRYVPYDSEVTQNMVGNMYENGVVEEENGPWGAMVVPAGKNHQENVPCHDY